MAKSKRLTQIRAGRLVSAVLYAQAMPSDEPQQRAAKLKASSAARQRLNQRASWQKLEQLLAANFDRGDLFVTLTYRDLDLPSSREQAMRCLSAFLRELRAIRARRGERLIYVKNVEHLTETGEEGRWHHHLVINATGSDFEEIRACWARFGDNVDIDDLLSDGWGYTDRAKYICKERPPVGKQTWTPSRGLARPERSSELVDDALTLAPPPGAIILEQEQMDNGWGQFVYLKYLLPSRPKRPGRRRMPRRSD